MRLPQTKRNFLTYSFLNPWFGTLLWMSTILGIGCGDSEPTAAAGDGGDDGSVDLSQCRNYVWEPSAGDLRAWPSREMLVDDAATVTGKRFEITEDAYPALADFRNFAPVWTEALAQVDGFGLNSAGFLKFDRPFDPATLPPGSEPAPGAGFVVVPSDGEPRVIAATATTTDDDSTLMLVPYTPLPPASRVALFLTRRFEQPDMGCLQPSSAMRELIRNPDDDVRATLDALTALDEIDADADLVTVQPFVTQSLLDETSAVADAIENSSPTLTEPQCALEGPTGTEVNHCVSMMESGDFRRNGVLSIDTRDAQNPDSWSIPVHAWLPTEGSPPFPAVVFGHGIGGRADEQPAALAESLAERGIVTIAIPAVEHAGHPTTSDSVASTNAVLNFFALNVLRQSIDALRLRDNFRQSTYDKLALTKLLTLAPDLDGDTTPDIDPDRLAYVGVSLGGIMGSELLSFTDAYGVAVLGMPGGRLTQLIGDADSAFGMSIGSILFPESFTQGDVFRLLAAVQTAMDRGDAASYARHIVTDRLRRERTPSVLVSIVIDDEVVTNPSNYHFARAAGFALVPPELREGSGLALSDPLPLSGNVADGMATAAVMQADVIRENGQIVDATHGNFPPSEVGFTSWISFIESFWASGDAEIIDAYELLEIPHR